MIRAALTSAVCLFLLGCSEGDPEKRQQWRRKLEAQQQAEKFVSQRLKHPLDAEFSGTEVTTTSRDGLTFVLQGKVRAKNDLGGQLTHRWEAVVSLEGDTWHLAACELDGKSIFSDQKLLDAIKARARP